MKRKDNLEIIRRTNGRLTYAKISKVCFSSGHAAAVSLPKEFIGKRVDIIFKEVKNG